MKLSKLFEMQKALDDHIRNEHDLVDAYLVKEKTLALLVELGELANETRCFKFWSNKPASEKHVILEEYVDGLHFVITLCIDKEISIHNANCITVSYKPNGNLVDDFLDLYKQIVIFGELCTSKERLEKLLDKYISFGIKLGFTWEEIEQAYIEKNEVNHQRQEEGY
jgi:dimeric dUTPase (all-alpha-NTP-PPase superfamily)